MDEEYYWGCRSAIQKAIRRSDLPLFEEAFDVIWDVDPAFLHRRMPVYACEEVWPLLGDTIDAYTKAAPGLRKHATPDAKEAARKILFKAGKRLVLSFKNQDAAALGVLMWDRPDSRVTEREMKKWPALKQKQFKAMRKLYTTCFEGKKEAREAWDLLTTAAEKKASEHPFVKHTVRAARYRYFMNGMPHEEDKFLAAAILAITEYHEMPHMTPPKTDFNKETALVRGKRILPYWAYDQHTRIGKTALYRAARRLNTTYDALAFKWFIFESFQTFPTQNGCFFRTILQKNLENRSGDLYYTKQRSVILEEIVRRANESGVTVLLEGKA